MYPYRVHWEFLKKEALGGLGVPFWPLIGRRTQMNQVDVAHGHRWEGAPLALGCGLSGLVRATQGSYCTVAPS